MQNLEILDHFHLEMSLWYLKEMDSKIFKNLFIKTENNLVMILCVIYLSLPFLEYHRRNENLFIFPPTWVITMLLQMENITPIILF